MTRDHLLGLAATQDLAPIALRKAIRSDELDRQDARIFEEPKARDAALAAFEQGDHTPKDCRPQEWWFVDFLMEVPIQNQTAFKQQVAWCALRAVGLGHQLRPANVASIAIACGASYLGTTAILRQIHSQLQAEAQ